MKTSSRREFLRGLLLGGLALLARGAGRDAQQPTDEEAGQGNVEPEDASQLIRGSALESDGAIPTGAIWLRSDSDTVWVNIAEDTNPPIDFTQHDVLLTLT